MPDFRPVTRAHSSLPDSISRPGSWYIYLTVALRADEGYTVGGPGGGGEMPTPAVKWKRATNVDKALPSGPD